MSSLFCFFIIFNVYFNELVNIALILTKYNNILLHKEFKLATARVKMFSKVISQAKLKDRAQDTQKRQSPRRKDDRCVSIIDGQMHPVENWSNGGLLVTADERLFAIGQNCKFTLKFKLRDKIVEVDHKATVVRKTPNKVAMQFMPLTKNVSAQFHKIVDDYVTGRFAESHSVI